MVSFLYHVTRLALIVNPHARLLREPSGLARKLRRELGRRGRYYLTRDGDELERAMRDALASGARTVVLAGGDGTFMAGVTAAWRARPREMPRFVFAPAGTVATVARNFGQRRGAVATLRRVLLGDEWLPATLRPTLLVSDGDGSERVGFTVGTGLVARFFERYEAAGAHGYGTAFRIVLRIFAGSFLGDAYAKSVLEPLPCKLVVNGRMLPPTAYSLVVCSVLRDLGLRMLVTYRAATDFQRPHLVASPLRTEHLGPQWPRVMLGRALRGMDNFDGCVENFRVEFGDGTGPYVLDGDTFRARTLSVSAGPVIDVVHV